MTVLKNSLTILWPYILCGAFIWFLWTFDLSSYVPLAGHELMTVRSVIYALLCLPVIYFSSEGIMHPQSKEQPFLLGLIIVCVLGGVSYLALNGLPLVQNHKPFLSFRYATWLIEMSVIFFLPAFVSAVMGLVVLKKAFFNGAQKQVEDEPYGSARLCSAQEANEKNSKTGLPIGRILKTVIGNDINLIKKIQSSKVGDIFRYDPVHTFLIAPTRSGKGVGFVVPTLLDYDGPVVCIDPKKAENFTVTSRHRSKNGTRKIYSFDTSDLTGQETACINVFDFLDTSDNKFIDDVKILASSLCPTSGDDRTDYFIKAAQNILSCLIVFVSRLPKPERNLNSVYDSLMQSEEELKDLFTHISKDKEFSHGVPSRIAKQVLSTDSRELSGCMNTARESLRFLDSPVYRHIISNTNISLDDIYKNKADLFFCIPNQEIKSHGHYFIKLVIALIVKDIKEQVKPPSRPTLIVTLLEMMSMGGLKILYLILKADAMLNVLTYLLRKSRIFSML